MGRFLVFLGIALAGLGVLISLGLPLGRLPGDFVIRRGNFTMYVPLATGLLASVVLTLVLSFLRR